MGEKEKKEKKKAKQKGKRERRNMWGRRKEEGNNCICINI